MFSNFIMDIYYLSFIPQMVRSKVLARAIGFFMVDILSFHHGLFFSARILLLICYIDEKIIRS